MTTTIYVDTIEPMVAFIDGSQLGESTVESGVGAGEAQIFRIKKIDSENSREIRDLRAEGTGFEPATP